MLSSFEALIHIRQQSRCPRILTCFCLLGFPTRYCSARFNGIKSNSRGLLILWAKCFAVSARSNLSWARYQSLMYADLYRVASSFFRIGLRLPANTSSSCSFSRGVITALVFVLSPDSLMMSGACLKSSQCPNTVQFDLLQLQNIRVNN